jgi:hypothetical protein
MTKKKILDLTSMSKEDQRKVFETEEGQKALQAKKYRFTVKNRGKTQYAYADDKETAENYFRYIGVTILAVDECGVKNADL